MTTIVVAMSIILALAVGVMLLVMMSAAGTRKLEPPGQRRDALPEHPQLQRLR